MTKRAFDGVIDAAHYSDDQLVWVRAYERRGAAFSDLTLLQRAGLVERLQRGKRFVTGRRTPNLAGTFSVGRPIQLVSRGQAIVIATNAEATRDTLEDVPVI